MPLQDIPWAIGGGAENDVEGARLALYLATNGKRGVIGAEDLRVSALPTPGPYVRIYSGAGVTPNDYVGGAGQSYGVREKSSTDFPVPATGSSGGAVRYLIILVEDEQYTGEAKTNKAKDPRNSYQWVSALPTTAPYVPLVRLDQPANTATITGEMLTDIRRVANPITGTLTFGRPRLAADDDPRHNYCNAKWNHGTDGQWWGELFPGGWGSPNMIDVEVPEDATHFGFTATWASVRCESNKNSWGLFWIEYGDEYRGNGWPEGRNLEFASQTQAFNTTGTQGAYNTNWILIDTKPIPKKLRGKIMRIAFKAGLSEGADLNGVYMNSQSSMGIDIKFTRQPVDDHTIQG